MPADETTLLTGAPQDNNNDADAFAAFVAMETTEMIAQNWRSILLSGVLNVITGAGCLMFPVFATEVAQLFIISLVFAIGLVNVLSMCCGTGMDHQNNPRQRPLFWVGVVQLLLAVLMYLNPFVTLSILTYFVAVIFMLLGSIQIAIARRYRDRMAARALMMFSGALSVLMSILICLTLPTAKYYTIGVLFGVNIFNVGINRVIIGLYGRKIASSDGSHESWRSYLDADLV